MKNKSKIGILSLGCPRNLVDSESILGGINSKGYQIVDINKADTVIVNTCAFIEDAKKESIDAILELIDLKKQGTLKRIIVYGCLSQRYGVELTKKLPEVDAFVGSPSLNHSVGRFTITPKHYAYLKICEGCFNNCSYCVIPNIKHGLTSLEEAAVLEKARALNKEKISELNIIGQDITSYGIDLCGSTRLADLLTKITKNTGNIHWLRLLYLYPNRVSDELLKVIRDEKRVCKYIDLPIQHINGRILKLMNRNTSKQSIISLIAKIRKFIPEVAIRTSLIVGFPSETDKEFKELLNFIEDIKFERLGVFTYSREEGTKAFDLDKQISQKVKFERFNTIMLAQQAVSRQINARFLNQEMEVLVEEKEGDSYLGRSQYDAPEVDGNVYVKSDRPLKIGSFVKVKIIDTLEYDLVAEVQK